jgi:hypothetical protein
VSTTHHYNKPPKPLNTLKRHWQQQRQQQQLETVMRHTSQAAGMFLLCLLNELKWRWQQQQQQQQRQGLETQNFSSCRYVF